MNKRWIKRCCWAGLISAAAPLGASAQGAELDELKQELEALRAEVAELRAQQQADRDERQAVYERAREAAAQNDILIKGLAGIDETGKIFFRSEDDGFTARITGLVQLRYIWNTLNTNNATGTRASETLSGLAINRVRFGIRGTVGERVGYGLQFGTSRAIGSVTAPGTAPANGLGAGDTFTEDAYITYAFDDNWNLRAGVARLAFARQELVSATRQVAVDRTLVNEFFTLNRADHAELGYRDDSSWVRLTLSDGGNANFTNALGDASNDFAITGRVDRRVSGEGWSAMRDEFAGDERALYVGGAVHYEVAEGGAAPDSQLLWTADALWKTPGYAFTAAVFGNHTENVGAADADQYGVYVQANAEVAEGWDVFGRWEYLDDGDFTAIGTDPLQAVTLGVNRHVSRHLKVTTDLVWLYAGDNQTPSGAINGGELSGGLGLSSTAFNAGDSHDDQVALRLQMQLLY